MQNVNSENARATQYADTAAPHELGNKTSNSPAAMNENDNLVTRTGLNCLVV